MHVITSRPSSVRVRLAGRPPAQKPLRRQLMTALDLVVRAFLIGVALGMLVMSQGHALVSILVTGIAAIGIALVSWDR